MHDKRNALDTLTPGDRVCWNTGPGRGYDAWGTITGVDEIHTVPGVNGPVFTGITVTVEVPNFPTWDSCGWPKSEPRTVKTRFDKYTSAKPEWAYTPGYCPECEHETGGNGGHGPAGCWACKRAGVQGGCATERFGRVA
jgi:hypothetical protein